MTNRDEIKIEKGIPFPTKPYTPSSPYGIAMMKLEVGDSFRYERKLDPKIRALRWVLKKSTGRKFIARMLEDTSFRIWRVEDEKQKIETPIKTNSSHQKGELRLSIENMKEGDSVKVDLKSLERVKRLIQMLKPRKFSYKKFDAETYKLWRLK